MIDKIKKLSTASYDEAVNLRRYMHMHPELSYHEEKTGAFITEILWHSLSTWYSSEWCSSPN
jgi:metal-dependent amidase/aminoacylase/carboxypeptidase family protein